MTRRFFLLSLLLLACLPAGILAASLLLEVAR
jgi:hypothetical protein